ncbi:MAG: hypothetical protein A2W03_17435 [Candidatus Aminicenantes bacterium RBG_16_63_16]|nr:MAG: hypothetical protein A2W03_17435 [Candidatus Aminicenantes bacterium RBG_16_63_16]
MSTKPFPKWIPQVIVLGAVWGLAEAALGLGLGKCAALASGSIMTGVALFFIAASWAVSQSAAGVALAVALVSLIKMFDALLLSLPLGGGAVANPIFAFWAEGLAFLVVFALLQQSLSAKLAGRAAGGALAGLAAVNLFPLVKFATGNPACVFPGTQIPLSLYYAPIAVALSAATAPLGLWAGARLARAAERAAALGRLTAAGRLASPAALILALLLIMFIRYIG